MNIIYWVLSWQNKSDDSIKRQNISDEGNGSMSKIFHGQRFEQCEIKSLSEHGVLSLTLMEDDKEIYKQRIEYPQIKLNYQRQ